MAALSSSPTMMTDEVVTEGTEASTLVDSIASASEAEPETEPVFLVNTEGSYWYFSAADGTSALPLVNYSGPTTAEVSTFVQQQQQYTSNDDFLMMAAENFEFANSQQLVEGVEGTDAAAVAASPEGAPSFEAEAVSHPFELCHHEEQVTAVEVESVIPFISPADRKKVAKKKRDRQKQRQQEYQQQMAIAAAAGEGTELNETLLKELSTKYAHQRFPIKLWNLASDEQFEPIKWADEGTSLIIDEYLLEPTLRYFFRSHKFSSFLRQLHLYGFRKMTRMRSHKGDQEKVRTDYISEYGTDNFLRGKLELAKKIRRFYGNIGGGSKKAKDEEEEEEEEEMMVEDQALEQLQPLSSASLTPLMHFDPSHQPLMMTSYMDFGQPLPMTMSSDESPSSLPYSPTPVFFYLHEGLLVPMTITYPTATATATCSEEDMGFSSQPSSPVEEKPPVQEEEEKVENVVVEKEEQPKVSIKEEVPLNGDN